MIKFPKSASSEREFAALQLLEAIVVAVAGEHLEGNVEGRCS